MEKIANLRYIISIYRMEIIDMPASQVEIKQTSLRCEELLEEARQRKRGLLKQQTELNKHPVENNKKLQENKEALQKITQAIENLKKQLEKSNVVVAKEEKKLTKLETSSQAPKSNSNLLQSFTKFLKQVPDTAEYTSLLGQNNQG